MATKKRSKKRGSPRLVASVGADLAAFLRRVRDGRAELPSLAGKISARKQVRAFVDRSDDSAWSDYCTIAVPLKDGSKIVVTVDAAIG